ncbi:TPA: hypothetical protein ACUP2A_005170 [Escherichia coli]
MVTLKAHILPHHDLQPPGCRGSAQPETVWGDPQTPHRCNTDGLRPPTNRVAACTVQMGFAGGWRGSWRPESPWLGVSARLTS